MSSSDCGAIGWKTCMFVGDSTTGGVWKRGGGGGISLKTTLAGLSVKGFRVLGTPGKYYVVVHLARKEASGLAAHKLRLLVWVPSLLGRLPSFFGQSSLRSHCPATRASSTAPSQPSPTRRRTSPPLLTTSSSPYGRRMRIIGPSPPARADAPKTAGMTLTLRLCVAQRRSPPNVTITPAILDFKR